MNGVKCCNEQEGASEVIFQKPITFFGGVGVFLIWVFFSCFFFEIKKKIEVWLIYNVVFDILYIYIYPLSDSFSLQASTGKHTQPKS